MLTSQVSRLGVVAAKRKDAQGSTIYEEDESLCRTKRSHAESLGSRSHFAKTRNSGLGCRTRSRLSESRGSVKSLRSSSLKKGGREGRRSGLDDSLVQAEVVRGLERRLEETESKIVPLRTKLTEATLTIKQLEYELTATKRSYTTKIDELTDNFT